MICLYVNVACNNHQNNQNLQEQIDSIVTLVADTLVKNETIIPYDYSRFYKLDTTVSYVAMKNEVIKRRKKLNNSQFSADSISSTFAKSLVYKIIPYWHGTPWAFDGYTYKPNNENIGCSYFVSTTLRDVGLKLNRYDLAKLSPIDEALALQMDSSIVTVSEPSFSENIQKIKDLTKDGIYFIGFDQGHVGFLYVENDELFVINSNYLGNVEVEVELMENSEMASGYDRFIIAELSTNRKLMKAWLSEVEIKI